MAGQVQIRRWLGKILEFQELGILTPLVAFSVFVGLTHPVFFSVDNLLNIAREVAFIGVMACAMTFVLVSGGIDLSVGSVLDMSGILTALSLVNGVPVVPAVIIGIAAGTFCGLLNGLAVVRLRIPPVIVTLGMLYAARGVILILTEGHPLYPLPKSFYVIGQGEILRIPIPVLLLLVVAIVMHLVLTRTRYGYWIRALGGNRESARLSGLAIMPLQVSVYVLSGLAAGIIGIAVTSRLSASYAQTGRTWELLVIASVIIGGTSLFGGTGTVIGSLIGASIIRVLSNALVILGVSAYWQDVFIGIIVVAAVAVDAYGRRLKQRRQTRQALAPRHIAPVQDLELDTIYSPDAQAEQQIQQLSNEPILEMQGITKRFGLVQALDDVSLELYPGEVLALVGDNGAGKSTLIKIASGALLPDRGFIKVAGSEVNIQTPRDASEVGIATAYQHLALVDCLDVATNLYLGREPHRGLFVNRKKMLDNARKALVALRIDIHSPDLLVENLSGGQRQAVAIAKTLLLGGRIVILDEPTAALGVEEQAKVLDLITLLRKKGHSVIVISHNLNHVFSVADRIAVLRAGRYQGSWPKAETTVEKIVSVITGADQLKAEFRDT